MTVSPMYPLLRRAAGSMVIVLAATAGCGGEERSAGGSKSEATPTATAGPDQPRTAGAGRDSGKPVAMRATYQITFPDDDEYVMDLEVFTHGSQRTRITYSVPGEVPPATYSWTWDGRQILEYINESDHPYWTLYQAPVEHRDVLDIVTMWMADPGSSEFDSYCADAEDLDRTERIAERPAEVYRCGPRKRASALMEGTIVWLDEESGLLLGWDSPGEGEEGAVTKATTVKGNYPIDKTTFSTKAPPHAKVKIVAPKS
jgi:hypothetical protein